MTAVITDVRYRMSLAIIRDLARAGVHVVCTETESCRKSKSAPPLGFFSKHCSESFFLPEDEKSYENGLFDLCKSIYEKEGSLPVIMPVGAKTLSLLADRRVKERFSSVCHMCVPDRAELDFLNSKEAVASLGEKLGIPVPKAYAPPYEDVSFPCVVKPLCGEKFNLPASRRYSIVKSDAELKEQIRHFESITHEAPIVQQYLQGGGFGCSVLAVDGNVVTSICHRRIREYPVSGGPSSCCVAIKDDRLLNYAKMIMADLKYTGIAMVEFKADNAGNAYLLEVNPRVWGSYPLTRAARSSMTLDWFMAAVDPEAASCGANSVFQQNTAGAHGGAHKADTYKSVKMSFFPSDILAGAAYLRRGHPKKFFSAIGDFFNPAVKDGLWQWNDAIPAIKYYFSLFRKGENKNV